MNNNSYFIISADKLEAIFLHCCPPSTSDSHTSHLARGDCFNVDCIDCWKEWLKDGE